MHFDHALVAFEVTHGMYSLIKLEASTKMKDVKKWF